MWSSPPGRPRAAADRRRPPWPASTGTARTGWSGTGPGRTEPGPFGKGSGPRPAQRAVAPARLAPQLGVQRVAPVQQPPLRDHRTQLRRVQVAELLPLGEVQYDIGGVRRLQGGGGVAERREQAAGVVHALGVVDGDLAALEVD